MNTTMQNPLVRERSTVQSCPAAPFSAENSTSDRQASEVLGSTNRELGAANVGKSLDLSAYRREVAALHDKATGTQRALLGLLARQLRTLERDPDRPGMLALVMQTIRKLAND